MSPSDKPFSVSDRRHFTPEGQPREEPEAERPAAARTPPSGEAAAPAEASSKGHEPETHTGPAEFGPFLLSLGAQAGMLLASEEQKDRPEALEAARSIISIIEMLRDKTTGRRTPDEDKIVDGLLFELRMAYVERRRGGTE